MNKLKTFVRTFSQSLTNPGYYKDILKAKFSFSLKYLILLLLIINLLGGIKFAVSAFKLFPQIEPFLGKARVVLSNLYPDKLVLTVKKQKITTNVKEPFNIEFPAETGTISPYQHLLTIDTKGKVDDYPKYESVLLLTADNLVTPDDKGEGTYKIVPLGEKLAQVPEGTKIDKAFYEENLKRIDPYLGRVPKMIKGVLIASVILLPFVITFLSLVWKLIYLLALALIFWILVKILKKKLSYGEVYRLSLHGLTLPITFSFALSLLGISLPFVYSLVLIIWMVVVLVKIKA